jgi:hypothetical protein
MPEFDATLYGILARFRVREQLSDSFDMNFFLGAGVFIAQIRGQATIIHYWCELLVHDGDPDWTRKNG